MLKLLLVSKIVYNNLVGYIEILAKLHDVQLLPDVLLFFFIIIAHITATHNIKVPIRTTANGTVVYATVLVREEGILII